jgi:hypothetical protein
MAPDVRKLSDIDHVADLLARLRLDRSARSRGVVVVEGPSDSEVLAATFGMDRQAFFPLRGRNNVLRFAQLLDPSSVPGVICVADRDFDSVAEEHAGLWHLVFSDNADLEAMLVRCHALDRVLAAWGSRSKLADFGGPESVRSCAGALTEPMSSLRTANAQHGHGWCLNEVDLADATNHKTLKLNELSLTDRVARASRARRDEIRAALTTPVPCCPETGGKLARGRDLIAIIGVALRSAVGSLTKAQVANSLVERSLRLTARRGDLDDAPFATRFTKALSDALAMAA